LQKISKDVLEEIKENIEKKLSTSPEIFGKPLQKSLKGYRRSLRISINFLKLVITNDNMDCRLRELKIE